MVSEKEKSMTQDPIPRIMNALQSGRFSDAEQLSRDALEDFQNDENLLVLLAMSLQYQKRMADAVEVYAQLTHLFPESSLHWGNYATALRDDGRIDAAAKAYAKALELKPDNADQLLNFGLLQLQQGQFLAARDTLLKAQVLEPDSPAIRVHAARACFACHDRRMEQLLQPWRQWLPLSNLALQMELADLLVGSGDAVSARQLLQDILQREPRHLPAQLLLANVYERINRADAAAALLQQIEHDHADLDEATRLEMAQQRATLAARRGDYTEARDILQRTGPRSARDYRSWFLLAKVCDKLADPDAALRALERAHEAQLEELREVVPHRFEPGAPVLPAAVDRVTESDYARWPTLIAPDAAQSPVFIVGFPRSGTTLLEQMLDAHPALQSMDERPFFNILADRLEGQGIAVPGQIDKLDQRDCDELRHAYLKMACGKIERSWDAQLVDKNPLNMLMLPLIHRLFPRARFILALRHPCDVILSNYMQSFRFSVLAVACSNLERLATAYVSAMDAWLYHVEVFKPQMLVSRYEDLVADPAQQTQRIAQFLGLEDAAPMLAFDQRARDKGYIATPSYTQVIEPVNRKGLNRWQRYRDAFEPALPILAPMLEHWGYSTEPAA